MCPQGSPRLQNRAPRPRCLGVSGPDAYRASWMTEKRPRTRPGSKSCPWERGSGLRSSGSSPLAGQVPGRAGWEPGSFQGVQGFEHVGPGPILVAIIQAGLVLESASVVPELPVVRRFVPVLDGSFNLPLFRQVLHPDPHQLQVRGGRVAAHVLLPAAEQE